MQCPRCFWLDARLRLKRPDGPPFNINKTIDELFKKEFDNYRSKAEPHPLMVDNKIKAIPFAHENLKTWRHNFTGVATVHKPTNFHVYGAIDDVWVNEKEELLVVDYKATAKEKEVTIDAEWQDSYKRQLEVYQWLLRQNNFNVNNTGYFVYTNARMDVDGFHDTVLFRTKIIPYQGDDSWIEPALLKMKACIDSDVMPAVGKAAMGGECDYCTYARKRTELTIAALRLTKKLPPN
jgi:hypothetical protein